MQKRRILTVLFLAFFAAAPTAPRASPDPPPQTDIIAIIATLKAKAEMGDAEAQNMLGFRYENGIGVPKDRKKAINWYNKAALQDYGAAQYNLCMLYAHDIKLFEKSALSNGPTVPPQPAEGTKVDVDRISTWCTKSANKGFWLSQRALGIFYARGVQSAGGAEIVHPDYHQAYFWLSMPATRRKTDFRDAIEGQLTMESRTEIKAKAANFVPLPKSKPKPVPLGAAKP